MLRLRAARGGDRQRFPCQARVEFLEPRLFADDAHLMAGQQADDRSRHVEDQLGPDRLPDIRGRVGLYAGAFEDRAQFADSGAVAIVPLTDGKSALSCTGVAYDTGRDHLIR